MPSALRYDPKSDDSSRERKQAAGCDKLEEEKPIQTFNTAWQNITGSEACEVRKPAKVGQVSDGKLLAYWTQFINVHEMAKKEKPGK